MDNNNNHKNLFNNSWMVGIALLFGSTGALTGTGIIPINNTQQTMTAEDIGKIVTPIVSIAVRETMENFYEERRKERFTEPKADFLHRSDKNHEQCLLSAPELTEKDTPTWAKALVKSNHYGNCDLNYLIDLSIREAE